MFLWQFFIPLTIFVVAYWMILGVIRQRTKVTAASKSGKSEGVGTETAAGTSTGTDTNASGSTSGTCVGNQNKSMSQAKINVIRTMIYIVVCFTLCWMPKNLYLMFMKLSVVSFDGHLAKYS